MVLLAQDVPIIALPATPHLCHHIFLIHPPMKRSAIEAADMTLNYSKLGEWLQALEDNLAHNKHGESFLQYTNTLVNVKNFLPLKISMH
jgi:hypothetical protein